MPNQPKEKKEDYTKDPAWNLPIVAWFIMEEYLELPPQENN